MRTHREPCDPQGVQSGPRAVERANDVARPQAEDTRDVGNVVRGDAHHRLDEGHAARQEVAPRAMVQRTDGECEARRGHERRLGRVSHGVAQVGKRQAERRQTVVLLRFVGGQAVVLLRFVGV